MKTHKWSDLVEERRVARGERSGPDKAMNRVSDILCGIEDTIFSKIEAYLTEQGIVGLATKSMKDKGIGQFERYMVQVSTGDRYGDCSVRAILTIHAGRHKWFPEATFIEGALRGLLRQLGIVEVRVLRDDLDYELVDQADEIKQGG